VIVEAAFGHRQADIFELNTSIFPQSGICDSNRSLYAMLGISEWFATEIPIIDRLRDANCDAHRRDRTATCFRAGGESNGLPWMETWLR
jgi:hypothetical protein